MQRRELVRILEEAGFISKGGTNHEKFVKGDKLVLGGYRIAQRIFKFN